MLQSQRQVVGGHDMADIRCGVGTHDTHCRGEDHEERHDADHTHDLRKDEVAGRVDAHDLESINLLGDAHRANLRGDVRSHLSSQDETHDRARELEEHDLTRGVARYPAGHPGALDIQLHLDADNGAYEERDEQDDANGVDTELRHFLDVLLEEHPHALRA